MTHAFERARSTSGISLSVWLLAVALVGIFGAVPGAEAKTPGKTYCFNGVCHYVNTLDETRRVVGRTTSVVASYYDDPKRDRFNPSNLTSSGEYFRAWAADNAASPVYPNGTKLVVWHPTTKKAVMVRVNNAGPYYGNRMLDLSRGAAEKIGLTGSGVKRVQMAVVAAPTREEASYKKGRTYAPVRGYIGQFASLDSAIASLTGVSKPTLVASGPVPAKPKKVAAKAAPQRTSALIPDEALKGFGLRAPSQKLPVSHVTLVATVRETRSGRGVE